MILYIVIVCLLAIAIPTIIILFRHIMVFDNVHCPDCDAHMLFVGEKKTDKGNVYVFQCPKCSAVKEIPTTELDSKVLKFYK